MLCSSPSSPLMSIVPVPSPPLHQALQLSMSSSPNLSIYSSLPLMEVMSKVYHVTVSRSCCQSLLIHMQPPHTHTLTHTLGPPCPAQPCPAQPRQVPSCPHSSVSRITFNVSAVDVWTCRLARTHTHSHTSPRPLCIILRRD